MSRTGKRQRTRPPAEADPNAPRVRIDLGNEASAQVARALSRPPRVVPALVQLFTDDHDHPADNTHDGDGSPT